MFRGVLIESRQAEAGDLRRASEVLGEAFTDYPWTRWTVDPDNHQERITRLKLLALENLGLAFGDVCLSSVEGTIYSVAVWMDSAVPVPPSASRALDPIVAQLEGSRHHASVAAARETEGWRPASEAGRGPRRSDVGVKSDHGRPTRCRVIPRDVVGVEPRLLFDVWLRGH